MDGELDELIGALSAEQQAEQLAQLSKKRLDAAGSARRQRDRRREARLLLAEAADSPRPACSPFRNENCRWNRADFLPVRARRKRGEPLAYIVGHKEFYA